MSFLPRDFVLPDRVVTERFLLRPITIHDLLKDYDAVMSSREHLWARFGVEWGWPREDMTIEQDLIDLAWHQKEHQLRSSFNYAVMSHDETRLLGCVYIDASEQEGVSAESAYWIRASELDSGLEEVLGEFVRHWIADVWPLERVIYPYNPDGSEPSAG